MGTEFQICHYWRSECTLKEESMNKHLVKKAVRNPQFMILLILAVSELPRVLARLLRLSPPEHS